MNRPSTKVDAKVSAPSKKVSMRKRLTTVIASLFLASGSILAVTSVPAAAAGATNDYYCSYWTGYCRQINPPHNVTAPNYCYVRTDVYYGYGMHQSNCDKIFY